MSNADLYFTNLSITDESIETTKTSGLSKKKAHTLRHYLVMHYHMIKEIQLINLHLVLLVDGANKSL